MRRFMTGMAAMAVVFFAGSMPVLAAEEYAYDNGNAGCAYCGAPCQYVDGDGDGICDNYAAGYGAGYVDAAGDGICDNYAAGGCGYCGVSCQYVDGDGDGICDNYAAGYGAGYVDEDGDGICDNYAAGNYCGRGYGRHYGRGRHCR